MLLLVGVADRQPHMPRIIHSFSLRENSEKSPEQGRIARYCSLLQALSGRVLQTARGKSAGNMSLRT